MPLVAFIYCARHLRGEPVGPAPSGWMSVARSPTSSRSTRRAARAGCTRRPRPPTIPPAPSSRDRGVRAPAWPSGAQVRRLAHGTTVATNALIQRTGRARSRWSPPRGFRDLLEIGRQVRPHMYDLHADYPPPLVPRERALRGDRARSPPTARLHRPLDEDDAGRGDRGGRRGRRRGLRGLLPVRLPQPRARASDRREPSRGAARISTSRSRPRCSRSSASTSALDHGAERLSAAGHGPLPRRAASRARRRGCRRPRSASTSRAAALMSVERARAACRCAPRSPGRRPAWSARSTLARLAGCAGRHHPRHGRHQRRRRADPRLRPRGDRLRPRRSRTSRSACRWSTSTPSAPAAARSPGSMRDGAAEGRAEQRRRRSRPRLLRPGRHRADRHRRQPACSAAWRREGLLGGRDGARRRRARARARAGRERARLHARAHRRTACSASSSANMVRAIRAVSVERGHDPRGFALIAFGGAGPLHATEVAAASACARSWCRRRPASSAPRAWWSPTSRRISCAPRACRLDRREGAELAQSMRRRRSQADAWFEHEDIAAGDRAARAHPRHALCRPELRAAGAGLAIDGAARDAGRAARALLRGPRARPTATAIRTTRSRSSISA